MELASSKKASMVMILLVIASCLSLSKVLRAEAKAMGKVSCDSTEDCKKAAGACFSSGKCDYEAALKVSMIDACSKDSDCAAPCDVQCKNAKKKRHFAQCLGGSCVCVCQTLKFSLQRVVLNTLTM